MRIPHGRAMHAARVAIVAALVVMACYGLCAWGVSLFVAQRLTADADARIHAALAYDERLGEHASAGSAARAASRSEDVDDAPMFLWRVGAGAGGRSRSVQALTLGAPPLPSAVVHAVGSAPLTALVGATSFRFGAVRRGSWWLVAGQSIANVGRALSALVFPEVLFGVLLAAAAFVGALLVGLRASAPIDLIRRRQAEFTADASHELRTPLSVVEAEVDLALRRRRQPAEYETVLRRIAAESRRLRRIVDDLLWLARADSGSPDHDRAERADVESVVASCVDRFQAIAARNAVALGFMAEGHGAGMVQAPAELVDRLAGVLIDNACNYAGPDGTVSVVVESTASRVVLRVDDSGPGIPPAQRTAVFDRFHRVAAEGGGSGLGLAIADSVVRITGGTWLVDDAPLGGARMEVSWRRVDAPGEDADVADDVQHARTEPPAPDGGRVPAQRRA